MAKRILERLKSALADLYAREPARVNAAIVAVVLAVAGAVGVATLNPAAVAGVVVVVAPILVAELTRPKVVPESKVPEIALARAFEEAENLRRATEYPGP